MSFAYKATLTVTSNAALLPSTQTDFPVLVSVTDNALKLVANGGQVTDAGGDDIVFYSDAGLTSVLNYELESYNGTTGTIVMWVKIASLALSTVFYAGIGNAAISSFQGNINGTWNSAYKGVWHLGDAASPALDSTSSAASGAQSGGVTFGATGKIGSGLTFDGTDDYLDASGAPFNFNRTDDFTVSAWFKTSNPTNAERTFIEKRTTSGRMPFELMVNNPHKFQAGSWNGSSGSAAASAAVVNDGNWHNGTYRHTNSAGTIYLDGVSVGSFTGESGTTSNAENLRIGSDTSLSRFYPGSLDEVRISNVARSADWITAEYNNQNDPATFVSAVFAAQFIPFPRPRGENAGLHVLSGGLN